MRSTRNSIVCLASVVFLLSCSSYYYDQTHGRYRKYGVEDYLRYFHTVKNMHEEDLNGEYARKEKSVKIDGNSYKKIEFALLLSLPNTVFHDKNKSIAILENIINNKSEKDRILKEFSFLLKDFIEQQILLEEMYKNINQELNDIFEERQISENIHAETRKQMANILSEKKKQETSNRKLRKKLKKNELLMQNLQQKIEQLKTIERNINERKNIKSPST